MMATLKTVNEADREKMIFRTNFVVKPWSLVPDGSTGFLPETFHPVPLHPVIP